MDKESHHISRLKKGDHASFEYLYNRWSGKLYNFVMRISMGDHYLAEELVQSVFIKVWENRARIDPDKPLGAYLCTIAKNQLVNIYQHRMLESLYQEKMKSSDSMEYTTEKEVDYHLLEEYINGLIRELPSARREIYLLSRHHLLTNKEIAERLNISENTVESQLTKALSFLRDRINRHYAFSVPLFVFALFS